MGARGPSPKPRLQVVKEGNPGKRRPKEQVQLPPGTPEEPAWSSFFPEPPLLTGRDVPEEALRRRRRADAKAAQRAASKRWREVVPILDVQGFLARTDGGVLEEHCICTARILQCEREVTRDGVWVYGDRGPVKHPALTALNQYRTQLRYTIDRLCLSPGSRSRVTPGRDSGHGGKEGDGWD